jgi:S-adenosylmethionine synthetase
MPAITVELLPSPPDETPRFEVVERKGIGHPDTICDAIMEDVSLALCREYEAAFGRVLHFNVDKCLLAAGVTAPRAGGGRVLAPMRLIYGDRAAAECGGQRIDVAAIAESAAKQWIRSHLRFVDPERHIVFQSELKEGSPELAGLFDRASIGANDTSAAVGCAPLTETEQLVLRCERELNSPAFKQRFPEAGEDVKVMAYRRDRELGLTVAVAFVDRFVPDAATYFARKQEITAALTGTLTRGLRTLDRVKITLNTLDDPARGDAGLYLTVLGTSAEGGDSGQVGRGNKVNGLISLNRPIGTEAVAGKNPVSHVGKIYTLLAHRLAAEIHARVPGIRETYVWFGSQIGSPLDQPAMACAQVRLEPGCALSDIEPAVAAIISDGLDNIDSFTAQLTRGAWPVC